VIIVVFEDENVVDLAPITTGRPAYGITCASYRLLDLLQELQLPIYGIVRPHLKELQSLDYQVRDFSNETVVGEEILAVNARLAPSRQCLSELKRISSGTSPECCLHEHGVAIAKLPASVSLPSDSGSAFHQKLQTHVEGLPVSKEKLATFSWPHDVVTNHMRMMNENLEARVSAGQYDQVQDGVFLAPGAVIGQYAAIDTSHGPIVLDRNVKVGPFCYLSGPVYAGPNTRVIEHAALKDGVSLGHTVKIGGEVEASVIEAYSNKQHHGFLGHSYLGSWINLGAGTCNSDLKNTYGTINMQYGPKRSATGMQFMGCIMGDYTKTAINTGIFTGKVVGVCSMLYGFVTSNVPSFVNYARLFGQTAELPPEVMAATQQRMFARRNVIQRPCDQQLIHDMHLLTEGEREGQLGAL
jgi:UDP-N-acetylglucosamine diphosphorylase/glucosamine-1-phosphate N-acetyltransferase